MIRGLMFESFFHKLGKFTEKNKNKVIIFWVVLFVIMAPFATLMLTDTSYNVTNSIVTKNSMASKANDLLESQFNNSTDPEIIIVANNTNIGNLTTMGELLNFDNQIVSYLKSTGVEYTNQTNIFTVENSTLSSYSNGIYKEENGTYKLIYTINNEGIRFNSSANSTLGLEFGLPAGYVNAFNNTKSNNDAYNSIYKNIKNNTSGLYYLNTFSAYWNSTLKNVNVTNIYNETYYMNLAINKTVENETFITGLGGAGPLFKSLDTNFTLNGYMFNYKEIPSMLKDYSIKYISSELESNVTSSSFIKKDLNIGVNNFVKNAYNLSKDPSVKNIIKLMVSEVYNGTVNAMNGNPLININKSYYSNYLFNLYSNSSGGKNLTLFSSNIISHTPYNKYPVLPSKYITSSLISPDNKTLLLIFHYDGTLTSTEQSKITSIEHHYTTVIPGSSYYLAGTTVSNNQLGTSIQTGLVISLLIGIIISIIIVGLFFRSPLTAFLPFLIFLFSAVIASGIIGILYKYVLKTTISFITPTLLFILLLGLASDYSVYILSRYRTELRNKNPDAVPEAAKWAGHAVFTSGTTVALSYVILYVSGIPIFSDAGLTNAIGAIIAIILANTFLIAIISKLKNKTFWPSKIKENKKLPFEKSMEKVAHVALHNKKKILVIFIVIALSALYLYSVTPTNMDVFELVPSSSGIQSLTVVNSTFHYDLFDPSYVILNFTSPFIISGHGDTVKYNQTEYNETLSLENKLMSSGKVTEVLGPGYPYGNRVNYSFFESNNSYKNQYINQTNTYLGKNNHYVEIVIYLSNVAWSGKSTNFVNSIPKMINDGDTYKGYVGGLTEYLNNAYSFTASSFDKLVPILGITIFIILFIQLFSVLTPIRLIIMVMAAVITSLTLTYILFYYILHLPLIIFLPLFVFITLLAVGLDYDIFMVTRVQENIMKGMDNNTAIKNSIIETGGVIIALGSLLFATFGALYFSGIGILEEIGVGLALGVLIDTFISWMFFVPVIMSIMDKYNWWPSKIKNTEK